MAEFTMEQAALLQYRLALQHRIGLTQLNNLTAVELFNLFDAFKNESDEDIAKGIRQTFPVIMQERGIEAALLSAAFYDQSRELYSMTQGASRAVNGLYIAQPQPFLNTPIPQQMIQERMDQVGFQFHEVFDNGKSMQMARNEIVQIAQRAPLDISYEAIKFDMAEDDAAKEEPKRISSGGGCNFCKHMAVFPGVSEEQAGKFHKGCTCSSSPAWAYEMDYRPDWADDHEEAYYKRADEIRAKNAELTRKQRQVKKTRVNSKGKTVTETKMETYYVDKSGKESKPESTSIKHILATMPRK